MAYNVYPAVDEKNAFPEPVRKAIAGSTEIKTAVETVVDKKLVSYPTIDSKNALPEPVRKALASSTEVTTAVGVVVDEKLIPVADKVEESKSRIEANATQLRKLEDAGPVTGRQTVNLASLDSQGIAFRHTTADGKYLPLGYTKGGRLDTHAINVWTEDLGLPEKIGTHPLYAKIIATQKNELLLGIRWDGGVDMPGLNGGTGEPSSSEVKSRLYQDAPYYPGSDIYPAHTDMKAWSGWGSSSMGGMNSNMIARAKELGATYYNGGQGGERSDHIAARLGSIPAELIFPSNVVPASGATAVTSSNMSASGSLRPYTGWVTATDGTRIHGKVSSTGSVITFTRTSDGEEAPVSRPVVFTPEEGPNHRGEVGFLWMGKNNINAPDKVISDTHISYEYFVPLVKNVIVMGHFMNGDQPASSSTRDNLLRVNAELRARYGHAYFDVQDYLTSPQVWTDTGLTPTEKDLSEQAIGNKPPSVSSDTGHLNGAGYGAVSNRLKAQLLALGWY